MAGLRAGGRTRASRFAAALLLALAVIQLWSSGVATHHITSIGATAVLCAASLTAGALLLRISCFETRLLAVVVCLVQLAVVSLALTLGLPGEVRRPLGLATGAALVVPLAVLALVLVDRRARRARPADAAIGSPYAR